MSPSRRSNIRKKKQGNNRSKGTGLPSGTILPNESAHATELSRISFSSAVFEGPVPLDVDKLADLDASRTHWINVNGLKDLNAIKKLFSRFKLHPLLQEDIYTLDHRPKLEEYENVVFVVTKMWTWNAAEQDVDYEQISFVLCDNVLLSFQEKPGDILDPVRERLDKGLGRVRKKGADYLLYALLDVVVDQGFVVVENLSDRISDLETQVINHANDDQLLEILKQRRILRKLLLSSNAVRELLGKTEQLENPLIEVATLSYFRDVQENVLFLSENIMGFKDTVVALENTYHAMINMQLNKVVQLLTVVSSVFIPLTFIAGIYGMNFENMPELRSKNGYFVVMIIMALMAGAMLIWFKRKKWL